MTLNAQSVPDPARPHLGLFNTEAFYGLRGMEWQPLDLSAAGEPVGTLVTTAPVRGWVINGRYAPWGGIDWFSERIPPESVDEALTSVMFMAAAALEIRCAPPHCSAASAAMMVALLNRGFTAGPAELSYWIDLPASVNDYERGLKHEARLALARTQDEFEARWLVDDAQWVLAFDVLEENRRAKGRRMSFDLDYLFRLRDAFLGLVRMLLVVDGQDRARAAALVYRVGKGRDYCQAWGDLPGFPGRSPMNVVAREVVKASIETGARSLNLGKSSNNGVPDGGLCRFKRSIGAKPEVLWTLAR